MMDIKRLERAADKIMDAFSDLRIEDKEIMYVAMYCVIKSNAVILERMVEFADQMKWEIDNRKENRGYVQDDLF
jgi:predicted HTH domain antitoxin